MSPDDFGWGLGRIEEYMYQILHITSLLFYGFFVLLLFSLFFHLSRVHFCGDK